MTTADFGDLSFSYPCHQHPLQRQMAMMAAFGSCGKKLEDWEAGAETAEVQMTIYQTTTMTATMVMTAASCYETECAVPVTLQLLYV